MLHFKEISFQMSLIKKKKTPKPVKIEFTSLKICEIEAKEAKNEYTAPTELRLGKKSLHTTVFSLLS